MLFHHLVAMIVFSGASGLAAECPGGICPLTAAPVATAAQSTASIDGIIGNLRATEAAQAARQTQLADRIGQVRDRMSQLDTRNTQLDGRIAQLEAAQNQTYLDAQQAELYLAKEEKAKNTAERNKLNDELTKDGGSGKGLLGDHQQISDQLAATRQNLAGQQALRAQMTSPGGGCGGGGGCGKGGGGSGGGGKGGGGGGGGGGALAALAIGGAVAGLAVGLALSGGKKDSGTDQKAAEAEKKRQEDALKAAEDEANKVAAKDAELHAAAADPKNDSKNRSDITALLANLYKDVKPAEPIKAVVPSATVYAQNQLAQPPPRVGVVDLRITQCFRMPGRVGVACRAGLAQICLNSAGQSLPCP